MVKESTIELKQLVECSGFTTRHLAENVLGISANHLRGFLNGSKPLSKIREKVLREYLEKVAEVPTVLV